MLKLSHYRRRQALRAPGDSRLPELDKRHMQVARLSALRTDWLYPQKLSLVLISVSRGVDPRVLVWPEGLSQKKIPMTPSEFKPATFRLVAQCLNNKKNMKKMDKTVWLSVKNARCKDRHVRMYFCASYVHFPSSLNWFQERRKWIYDLTISFREKADPSLGKIVCKYRTSSTSIIWQYS